MEARGNGIHGKTTRPWTPVESRGDLSWIYGKSVIEASDHHIISAASSRKKQCHYLISFFSSKLMADLNIHLDVLLWWA